MVLPEWPAPATPISSGLLTVCDVTLDAISLVTSAYDLFCNGVLAWLETSTSGVDVVTHHRLCDAILELWGRGVSELTPTVQHGDNERFADTAFIATLLHSKHIHVRSTYWQ